MDITRKQQAIALADRQGRCEPCPTYHGLVHGTDPEAHQIAHDSLWVEEIIKNKQYIYCPWRGKTCVAHPLEMSYAQYCHATGIKPDIHLAPCFSENERMLI